MCTPRSEYGAPERHPRDSVGEQSPVSHPGQTQPRQQCRGAPLPALPRACKREMEGFSPSEAMSIISKHILQSFTVLESFSFAPPGVSQRRVDTKPTVLAMCTAVRPLDGNSFQAVHEIMSDCWSTSKRTIFIDNLFSLSDSVLQRPETYLKFLSNICVYSSTRQKLHLELLTQEV